MKRLRVAGLSLGLLLCSTQVGAARVADAPVKKTKHPIWAVAIDGVQVAYSAGGLIHVWNLETGKTTTVSGRYANALHTANASQLAIAGNRVAWVKDQQFGNTEEGEKLYSATVGGKAKLLVHVYRYGIDDISHTTGGWIDGLIGGDNTIAVSTWVSNGTDATDEQLSSVTPNGLLALGGGVASMVSRAIDGSRIATLQSSPWSTSTGVSIWSTNGAPLANFPVHAASEIALTGNVLAVLIPSPTPEIEIYDATTGVLEHTWPAEGATTASSGPHRVAHIEARGGLVFYSVYTGYIGSHETLHVLDPTTGKDAVVATVKGFGTTREWAIGSRGLVYVLNSRTDSTRGAGKIVFVATAKLAALLGE